jgi:hypothetical protein
MEKQASHVLSEKKIKNMEQHALLVTSESETNKNNGTTRSTCNKRE